MIHSLVTARNPIRWAELYINRILPLHRYICVYAYFSFFFPWSNPRLALFAVVLGFSVSLLGFCCAQGEQARERKRVGWSAARGRGTFGFAGSFTRGRAICHANCQGVSKTRPFSLLPAVAASRVAGSTPPTILGHISPTSQGHTDNRADLE